MRIAIFSINVSQGGPACLGAATIFSRSALLDILQQRMFSSCFALLVLFTRYFQAVSKSIDTRGKKVRSARYRMKPASGCTSFYIYSALNLIGCL
jgi:hypothetical protein